MPADEDYHARPVVKVNGRVLPEQAVELLTEVYVDDSVHAPGLIVLRFSDPHDLALAAAGLKMGVEVAVAAGSSRPGTPQPLMTGTVTALEREIDSRGSYTVVRALDGRYKLLGGGVVATYIDLKISDVVKQVATKAGLAVKVDQIGPIYPQLTQAAVSDWDFLSELARSHGAVLSMDGKTLNLSKPAQASSAPSGTSPMVIDAREHVLHLRATITSSGQVPGVESRGWSPKQKQAVSATATAASPSASLSSVRPAELAAMTSSTPQVVSHPELTEAQQVKTVGAAQMGTRAGSFAELDAQLRGNPFLHAATPIALTNAGAQFDGKYVLTAVRHTFDPVTGFVTDITVADTSDRSGYGVLTGAPATAPTHRGMLPAVVTNIKDPENYGRVKVKFPTLSDTEESWWARVVQPGAGKGRGTVVLPEVSDEVLVAFAGTGMEAPYVLGGVYNGRDLPAPGFADHIGGNGEVVRRGFTSRTGMAIEMLESPSGETLNITTKDAKQRLTLVQKPSGSIEIIAEGPITVESKQKLSLTGQDVDIVAKNAIKLEALTVETKASNAAKINATTLDLEASANLNVKSNANMALKANAMAELSTSGILTVRGSLVKIN